jgi:redox-sensitive bicupin YhaK (pirin superfamily)
MAWQMPDEPFSDAPAGSPLETVIVPRTRDLGDGFSVRRALPCVRRRMVGPFIFWDQIGPVMFAAGKGLDVRPHPHIGLATVTYLFEGEILHRDTLGMVAPIRPGAVNWMTAGKGIAHSERTPPEIRAGGGRLSGIQAWVALPKKHEEIEPSFIHTPAEDLPIIEDHGKRVRLVAGSLYGARSPVKTLSELFYADAALEAGATLELPATYEERAVFVAEGSLEVSGDTFAPSQLLIFRPGDALTLRASTKARLLLLGGEPMDGPRHIFWNFVSSSRDQIEQAKADWVAGRFKQVPGETDFIPLPEEVPPPPVRYP